MYDQEKPLRSAGVSFISLLERLLFLAAFNYQYIIHLHCKAFATSAATAGVRIAEVKAFTVKSVREL